MVFHILIFFGLVTVKSVTYNFYVGLSIIFFDSDIVILKMIWLMRS